jgi:hypothetical protein
MNETPVVNYWLEVIADNAYAEVVYQGENEFVFRDILTGQYYTVKSGGLP